MPKHVFKTIYFPRDRVRAGKSARVTVSLPGDPSGAGIGAAFLQFAQGLSSRAFRLALGDPELEALEERAHAQGRSLSNVCLGLLVEHFEAHGGSFGTNGRDRGGQSLLSLASTVGDGSAPQRNQPKAELGVTFQDSLRQHVYGWYPYVEGFSATYTRDAILRCRPRAVYDPFSGCGTTQLAASLLGIPSFYSEINPFMAFVAETKVNASQWARKHFASFRDVTVAFLNQLRTENLDELGGTVDLAPYRAAFPGRDFFVERDLRHLLAAREVAVAVTEDLPAARSLLLLACAANAVASSNMTRRADLRRRRENEYKTRVVDVARDVSNTVRRMLADVERLPVNMAPATQVSNDCREVPAQFTSSFDLALTSPPYLNGTNYFRNTKIELWLLGFIRSEGELSRFRRQAICAGINNVSKHRDDCEQFASVESVATRLDDVTRDRRIPLLVRHYFSDMKQMFVHVHRALVPGGTCLLDIGDSKFYGVHVPTHDLLVDVARVVGFALEHRQVLARRYSRDKSDLVQVELVFKKTHRRSGGRRDMNAQTNRRAAALPARIKRFRDTRPYKAPPYRSRNWGHPLHSLCSYQGKLKPALAHWLIRAFVPPAGRVLDPLGGVGTIAFEAALQGREAVSNDMSPLAAVVGTAKLDPPTIDEAEVALQQLSERWAQVALADADFAAAEFGLNGRVADFYHQTTLAELLQARRVFCDSQWPRTRGDNFVWASLLHVLHGNRPYALSRTSHPITPFHPKGPAEYKSVLTKVRARLVRALQCEMPATFRPGTGIEGDFRALLEKGVGRFDAIVTSPPFLGMRFDRPNWLRLWFCGWSAEDFHQRSLGFLERQQVKDTRCYADFFEVSRRLLTTNGVLIMHFGSGGRDTLVDDLRTRGTAADFHLVGEIVENVQSIEQHGIRDKGRRTTDHHLLFFSPR